MIFSFTFFVSLTLSLFSIFRLIIQRIISPFNIRLFFNLLFAAYFTVTAVFMDLLIYHSHHPHPIFILHTEYIHDTAFSFRLMEELY